ncbi:protein FAM163A-like [Leucoraja erinacea]|uniref:protein FAM163A-like n=1 Tax=Leucoraja erinaceus TaxID=7782 RepID=UPI0024580160|nr:protein FAM163A-like [Leucoraja erinacea]XP_055497939.1 protein FAM163A-like [Leucoraja erinacea]
MTAGTVVITGGILATVILLCIIGVLCYCRLQYYCCKSESDDEEEDSDLHPHPHLACDACNAHFVDGFLTQLPAPVEPRQAAARASCPDCSPRRSPFYIQTAEEMRNGGDRVAYTPARYKEAGPPFKMASLQGYPVSRQNTVRETMASVRAISTEV